MRNDEKIDINLTIEETRDNLSEEETGSAGLLKLPSDTLI